MSRPIGSKNNPKQEPVEDASPQKHFTGYARSIECVKQYGFNNFYIVTLKIEDDKVVSKKVSEPYALFEAIARLEIQIQAASLNLNSGYAPGLAWKE